MNYRIKPGDTLTKIARAYGVTVSDLKSENNISDVNHIKAGSTLTIPNPYGGVTLEQIQKYVAAHGWNADTEKYFTDTLKVTPEQLRNIQNATAKNAADFDTANENARTPGYFDYYQDTLNYLNSLDKTTPDETNGVTGDFNPLMNQDIAAKTAMNKYILTQQAGPLGDLHFQTPYKPTEQEYVQLHTDPLKSQERTAEAQYVAYPDVEENPYDTLTFSQAFKKARSLGQKTFAYKGNLYTTELK